LTLARQYSVVKRSCVSESKAPKTVLQQGEAAYDDTCYSFRRPASMVCLRDLCTVRRVPQKIRAKKVADSPLKLAQCERIANSEAGCHYACFWGH
jgi:hypothetical protein